MPLLPVTSLAAVALATLFCVLALAVVRRRGREKVLVGTGSETLTRAVRAHGNLCETAPLVLILLALAEVHRASSDWLALVAAAFVVGRVAHAYGLVRGEPAGGRNRMLFRIVGMATTFGAITALAATILTLLAAEILNFAPGPPRFGGAG